MHIHTYEYLFLSDDGIDDNEFLCSSEKLISTESRFPLLLIFNKGSINRATMTNTTTCYSILTTVYTLDFLLYIGCLGTGI